MNNEYISIGVFLPMSNGRYFSSINKGIVNSARNNNVKIIFFNGHYINSPHKGEKEQNIIYSLASEKNLDGLIIYTSSLSLYTESNEIDGFLNQYSNLPIISIGTNLNGYNNILTNNEIGMKGLINHLIKDHEYQRIAFISGPENSDESKMRLNAYKQALLENNLKIDPSIIFSGNFRWDCSKEIVDRIVDSNIEIEAIACANDDMALGCYSQLIERGIRIPDDIALTGFDDINTSSYIYPPLTTVKQSFIRQGEKSVELILDLIQKKGIPEATIIPTELVVRQSCGCKPSVGFESYSDNQTTKNVVLDKLNDLSNMNEYIIEIIDGHFYEPSIDLEIFKKAGLCLAKDLLGAKKDNHFYYEVKEIIFNENDDNLIIAWKRSIEKLLMILMSNTINLQMKDIIINQMDGIHNLFIERFHIFSKQVMDTYQQKMFNLNELLVRIEHELDLNYFFNTIKTELCRMDINCFYLVLFHEDKLGCDLNEFPVKKSRLLLGYEEGELNYYKNGIIFDTSDLFPNRKFSFQRENAFYFLPLSINERYFGYTAFEFDEDKIDYFEPINNHLRNSFNMIKQFNDVELIVKSRTDDLRYANEKLKSLDDMKNDFIANITHDFRSPLSIILNTADIIQKYDDKNDIEVLANRVKTIKNASLKLKSAIDRLLDLAKMDSDGLKLKIQEVKPKKFIANLVDFYQSAIHTSGIKILDILPQKEIEGFYSDIDKLEEILSNLISNAIKFIDYESGEIIISLSEKDSIVEIMIQDNGIGIEEDMLDAIFNRFEQVESGMNALAKGTGIGLAYAKQLTEYLKGSIYAKSDGLNEGASFILQFKKGMDLFDSENVEFVKIENGDGFGRIKSSNIGIATTIYSELNDKKVNEDFIVEEVINQLNGSDEYDHKKGLILIVDDNAEIREIEKTYLLNNGFKNIILANDGIVGLNCVYKYRPDFIICDFNMPRMGGDIFHDTLVSNPDFKKLPVVFVTALADRSALLDRQRKGAIAYLGKPIVEDELITTVNIHLKKYMEYKEILMQATIDELTGINNRRSVLRQLKKQLTIRELENFSLVFFDIDHFKKINDSYGHQTGDKVLTAFGEIILECIRFYDVAGRYGGEEFILLLPKTDRASAVIVAKKIQCKIKNLAITDKHENEIKLSASFGISSLLDDKEYILSKLGIKKLEDIYEIKDARNTDWKDVEYKKQTIAYLLIEAADIALYHAKATHCRGCSYKSDKIKDFINSSCPECGSKMLSLGRDRIATFDEISNQII